MSVLEFSVYAGFSVESKTFGISSSSTLWQDLEARTSHAMKQTWLQEARDSTREDDKLRGPNQKSVESCKTWSYVQFGEKLTLRAYMQKEEGSRKQGNRHRAKEASGWAWMGPGWPAQADRPSPVQGPVMLPFALATNRAIYSPVAESHGRREFVIGRRGAEKRGTPSRRGEGRASWLGFP
jgi:hypothetical protein